MRFINNFNNRRQNKKILGTKKPKKDIDIYFDDKVDDILLPLPFNDTDIISNNITTIENSKLNNPLNHIHNEGQCLCLFILLLLYYSSIITTKIKNSFNNKLK